MTGELLKQRAKEMKDNVNEFKQYQSEFKEKINDKGKFNACRERVKHWQSKPCYSVNNKKKLGLFCNKKGAMAFDWVYALVFLFGLGVIYIVFNQVLTNDVLPFANGLVPDDFAGKGDIVNDNNTWMTYWNAMPFVLLIIVLLFLFVKSLIKKDY